MTMGKKSTSWRGLSSLCSCVLLHFEKTQTNLDDIIFHRTLERDNAGTTKVFEVQMRKTDSLQQIRNKRMWAGKEGKKDRGDTQLFYWAVRTEQQDLVLCEILCKIFQTLKTAGFTHIEHTLEGRKLLFPIESFQRKVLNIVPRSTILGVRGATGWSAPDASGVAHHYMVGTADDGSKLAIDLAFAPFHPEPKTSTSEANSLAAIFKIAQESAFLDHICFSHKPLHSTSKLETEAAIKSPLFKQKLATFFENFPLTSGDIKNTGNVEFEDKRYSNSLLWYSLGISVEENVEDSELIQVLYSNRSTANYQLQLYNEALEDAESAIRLAPHWPKGYLRKSAVLTALGRETEAQEVIDEMEAAEKELTMPKNKKRKA